MERSQARNKPIGKFKNSLIIMRTAETGPLWRGAATEHRYLTPESERDIPSLRVMLSPVRNRVQVS